jgi:hypothetical protein
MQNERLVAQAFRLCFSILVACFFTLTAFAQKQVETQSQSGILPPEQAAKEGRALVAQILAQRPAQNSTNTGVMTIRNADNKRIQIPIRFVIVATAANWFSAYDAVDTSVKIVHDDAKPNEYWLHAQNGKIVNLSADQAMSPFAGSDFWIADLGLEFLHWPQQNVAKKEMRRGRSCKVLESVNPNPARGTYSRVVAWIDNESSGIVHADAYDSSGKLLKQFDPKDFKKVDGQWQLQEMQIINVQTDSSTRVDFNLESGK